MRGRSTGVLTPQRPAGWLTTLERYRFSDSWRVDGTVSEVAEVLLDSTSLPQWWTDLSSVTLLQSGEQDGLGRVIGFHAKSWAPFTLQLECHVTQVSFPNSFAVEMRGDFHGQGRGRLEQIGSQVQVAFELEMVVRRRLLRILSFLARPAMKINHRLHMVRGQRGLDRELVRRRTPQLEAS